MYGIRDTQSRRKIDDVPAPRVLQIPMTYHGAQFRAARAALGLKTREIAAGASMSMQTLNAIERAGIIQFDGDDAPRGHEAAVLRLVAYYRRQGVTFLPNAGQGIGIRFKGR